MRRLVSAVSLAAVLACASGCVHPRWPAKTLADGIPIATNVVNATIPELRALPRPPNVGYFSARMPQERQVYRVRAELLRFALASDGDVHLTIAVPSDPAVTMVAEIPDPDRMIGAPAYYRNAVARTRRDFVATFGRPLRNVWHQVRRQVVLTGPIFFDFVDQVGGETGVAPNGIEIHPVLRIVPVLKSATKSK